jgi:hypothetical protein
MILKSNLNEISELNINNENQVILFYNQIDVLSIQKTNLENELKIEENVANQREIVRIQEEIKNLSRIISENEKTKKSILASLENTIKTKKKLKSILLRLLSNSKETEVTDWHVIKILKRESLQNSGKG